MQPPFTQGLLKRKMRYSATFSSESVEALRALCNKIL